MQIDNMTANQLRLLRERIDATILLKQQRARHELRDKFAEMAAEVGLSLSDFAGAKPSKPARVMQWRDAKTGVEWTGRGRMPFNFSKARAERI